MIRKWFSACVFLIAGLAGSATAAEVVIQEWDVPTARSRPHDPEVAPDGSLWYTGQMANVLGRVDPRTGEIKEYKLKTARSGPHGLVADKEGNIWFTANFKAYIGKLNPKTGEVVEYPMPDPRAKDPHTPIFDQNGTLWFTVQSGNFVGRLDPKIGKVVVKESPTKKSLPYGIRIDSKGMPWFSEFASNKLASIDPATMEIREYILPQGARPRRLTIAGDDTVYYTDYARGYLGHFDPKSARVEEWLSPGGEKSRPYGIAATPDGMIWYSESTPAPNTIVQFDPGAKSFKTWPIPSGGGVVRHIVATPDGNLYIACSGENTVGIVRIKR